MTYEQKMQATYLALAAYKNSLSPSDPDYSKAVDHVQWRDDYYNWCTAQRSAAKAGFAGYSDPPGLETPPPPPNP